MTWAYGELIRPCSAKTRQPYTRWRSKVVWEPWDISNGGSVISDCLWRGGCMFQEQAISQKGVSDHVVLSVQNIEKISFGIYYW
jgi:hypothetical protein